MKKSNTSLWIFIIYIIAQLSAVVGLPIVIPFVSEGRTPQEAYLAASGWWMFIAFGITTIAALILSNKDKHYFRTPKGKRSPLWVAIVLGIAGFFMVLFGQGAAGMIEQQLGIEPGSDNTAALVSVADMAPVAIVAVVLFAPILEEFIFRRIIFGGLVDRTNFFVAAAVSSLVFAAVHMDFTHILLYAASGFIFAFLYHVTKRLITSIIAHMLLNGFVMAVQLNLDKIQEFIDQMERIANMQ
ncbi:exosortase E/protease, VPEID-CTERM system [Bhargavaea cecembensis DSE10]|uniref:Exosortase E/protease, VPEID-CTERM system n=1 Tax=Bhargavaea cecembensis DSE10 TaxID=1235279 RepID=M7NUQ2_9BACL|nr:CPBP family intramembrane glutamic endopeptidase [Bhargavaea cecembensis]EMR05385.1 exosortase E/protease, VPEID-CTERM system [Bhargavaea cecembensis DSE10]